MKLVSFSLFGRDLKYQTGAIKNAIQVRDQMPEWKCRFYVSTEIPSEITQKLVEIGAQVILRDATNGSSGMFWRFEAAFDQDYQHVIIRDCDSRIDEREYVAIKEWVESRKDLHIIRDHPMHDAPILGGLWGVRPSSIFDLTEIFLTYKPKGYYGEDQEFLANSVYRKLKRNSIVHDSFFYRDAGARKFKTKRKSWEYCGESYDENEQVSEKLRCIVKESEESNFLKIKLKAKSIMKKFVGR